MDFRNYYTEEDFKKDNSENFEKAIIQYLKDRAKSGQLKMPDNSLTHESIFLDEWKKIVDQKSGDVNRVAYAFSKMFFTFNDNYEKLVQHINQGSFNKYDLSCDNECFGCGEKMLMISKDWNFKLITNKLEKDQQDFKKWQLKAAILEPCIEDKITTFDVSFPSGELLIADWFRIEKFTEKVMYNKDYQDLSIGTFAGRVKSTLYSAQHNFIMIHTAGSPDVFLENEKILFGSSETKSSLGRCITDKWSVCVIDKQTLFDIVGSEKEVNDYIKENDILSLQVQPGNYTTTFHHRKNLNLYDEDLSHHIQTIFSITKTSIKKPKLN